MEDIPKLAKLRLITRFIQKEASLDELLWIMEEIIDCHDNVYAYNPKTKSLLGVVSICKNGENLQLNTRDDG